MKAHSLFIVAAVSSLDGGFRMALKVYPDGFRWTNLRAETFTSRTEALEFIKNFSVYGTENETIQVLEYAFQPE